MTTRPELSDADKLRLIAEKIMGWRYRYDTTKDGKFSRIRADSEDNTHLWNPITSNDDAAELRRRLWEMGYSVATVTTRHNSLVAVVTGSSARAAMKEIPIPADSDPIAAEHWALVEAAAEVAERLAGPRHHHPDLDDSVSY